MPSPTYDTVVYGGGISAAANSTGRLVVGPLLPGDSLDGITLLLRTTAAHADLIAGVDVAVELHAHDQRPRAGTDAESRAGKALIGSTNVPMEPGIISAGTVNGTINVKIPAIHRPTNSRGAWLVLTITAPTNVGVSGSAWFDVFRPVPDFAD